MDLKRWLAVGAGADTVRLLPVEAPSTGPDVFCKLLDAEAAVAAERERCAQKLEAMAARIPEGDTDRDALLGAADELRRA